MCAGLSMNDEVRALMHAGPGAGIPLSRAGVSYPDTPSDSSSIPCNSATCCHSAKPGMLAAHLWCRPHGT